MTQREDMILTKIDRTESFGVFISYSECLSYVYDLYLDKKASQSEKYKLYQKLEKSLVSVQEYMTKAEKYLQKLSEYVELPEKFVDLSNYPQITYKNIDPMTESFSNFIEDVNKAYDNFFKHLVGQLMEHYDPEKNYNAYLENKPKTHQKSADIEKKKTAFISSLRNIHKDAFIKNFDEMTKVYFELNKKRNAINHHGGTKDDLMSGHYTVSIDSDTKKVTIRTLPIVKFYEKNYNIVEYSNYIFMSVFMGMQHIFVACVNTLIDTKKSGGNGMIPNFFPVSVISGLPGEDFIKQSHIFSPTQIYIFGYLFNENNFVAYQGSRPQDPNFLEKLKKLHRT